MQRVLIALIALGFMAGVALLSGDDEEESELLLMKWANAAPSVPSEVAILVRVGMKDARPTDWPGQATVDGATLVRRETYRFREGDELTEPNGWKIRTRRPAQPRANRPNVTVLPAEAGVIYYLTDVTPEASLTIEITGEEPRQAVVNLADVLAGKPQRLWNGNAQVCRISTDAVTVNTPTEDDFPAACYGPDGTLWLAYISYDLQDENRRYNYPRIDERPQSFKDYRQPGFHDQLFVKSYREGRWSKPVPLTSPNEDLVRCAIATDAKGVVWVSYSANRAGNFDIYARPIRDGEPGAEQRLTKAQESDLTPVMCTGQNGQVYLAYQTWEAKEADIVLLTHTGERWESISLVDASGNQWAPALAAGPNGEIALARDIYRDGDYDVILTLIQDGKTTDHIIAGTAKFEARPSLSYDAQGRLWIAYEVGSEKWGKDFGALVQDEGSQLYRQREVRLVCLSRGQLHQPPTPPTFTPGDANVRPAARKRTAYAKVGLDGNGRIWLTYRQKINTPFGVQPGTEWITYATQLQGDTWTTPMEITHSGGLLDNRPVLLPRSDGALWILTNADDRWITPGSVDNQIYACGLAIPGGTKQPALTAIPWPESKPANPDERAELADVQRIRRYRINVDGTECRLLRGEFHRHTEISMDGGNDGSLEDMFRYGIDVAHMDWIGNGDHDNGSGREYTWWITQKYTDAYFLANHFTPMFTYERSVSYPHGHRNCMFAERGILTLPRLAEADPMKRVAGIHADDTKMLYDYLHELGGICAVHTSATSMGTDWRDNDPEVEPFVEIYQGDRNSYEMQAAPRAGYAPDSGMEPVNIAGWFPDGYVDLALTKGYKLGFQSSSDHISTHISYCIAIAEEPTRESMLKAFKERHCYGATDNIVLDVRCGDAIMGDEITLPRAPKLEIRVLGTKPVAKIDILKDSKIVETFTPGNQEVEQSWTDPEPSMGTHWYYVRVQQEDGELAWSSPIWVTR